MRMKGQDSWMKELSKWQLQTWFHRTCVCVCDHKVLESKHLTFFNFVSLPVISLQSLMDLISHTWSHGLHTGEIINLFEKMSKDVVLNVAMILSNFTYLPVFDKIFSVNIFLNCPWHLQTHSRLSHNKQLCY